MKVVQRLEYTRLAEALADRGLVDAATSQQILQQCAKSGELYTELLVQANLVADWELARIVSETFTLPFLPVDVYEPAKDVAKGLDHEFLHRHCIVPLDRVGIRLSVSMPGMVSADVLASLGHHAKATIVPLVGSVAANRNWLYTVLGGGDAGAAAKANPNAPKGTGSKKPAAPSQLEMADPLPQAGAGAIAGPEPDGAWSSLFDDADQQIQQQNQKKKDAA
ncbi:MAG: hypothetical protein EPO68_00755 [Planctomycetota bacterium]|nr:MAG: hypothetical protein EPO68_00755 [Planctomycetota bacterium]